MVLQKLPERGDEIPRGFLSEIWGAKEALPRFSSGERFLYFLSQGIRNVVSLPITSSVSIITVAVSVFLFLGILLLFSNTENILATMGNSLNISVYLKPDTAAAEGRVLAEEIKRNPSVISTRYLSREDALRTFRESLGERAGFLDGVEKNNPLPASIEIDVRPTANAKATAEEFVTTLRKHVAVEDVVHGAEWLEQAQAYVQAFRAFSLVVMGLVFVVVTFLISSTTKLILYSRRSEIEIMQLVGASDWFVKAPFLLGGAVQGLVGTAFGLALVYGAFLGLRAYIGGLSIFGAAVPELNFLTPGTVWLVVIVGTGLATLASLVAIRRFMDV